MKEQENLTLIKTVKILKLKVRRMKIFCVKDEMKNERFVKEKNKQYKFWRKSLHVFSSSTYTIGFRNSLTSFILFFFLLNLFFYQTGQLLYLLPLPLLQLFSPSNNVYHYSQYIYIYNTHISEVNWSQVYAIFTYYYTHEENFNPKSID